MQKKNSKLLFSPSDLIYFLESPFVSWLNRYNLEFPGKIPKDETDPEREMFAQAGLQFEKEFLNGLKQKRQSLREISHNENEIDQTLKAMAQGNDFIYQAAIGHGEFRGYADFLHKVPGESTLGDYHYEPWDTKLALKAKPYYLIQLCCYTEILEALQGRRSDNVAVVLRDEKPIHFRTSDYFYYYLGLKKAFLDQMNSFDPNKFPEPVGNEDFKHWSSYAKKLLEDADHLIRVANIRIDQIKKLRQAGIQTLRNLAQSDLPNIPKMDHRIFDRLKAQARLQLQSQGAERPAFEEISPDPENPFRGLALLPPASEQDIYFDMEGYTLVEDGLEYLFGATHIEGAERKFIDFWAHNRAEEKKAFEGFIDWAFMRFQKDPRMHIYHYGNYEVAALRRLAQRHGSREEEVDHLLRHERFVDLYKLVKQGLMVGEPSYSLKNIERLYQEIRAGEVTTAGGSMVNYQRWLESPDGPTWTESKILRDIRDYNREDCDSTLRLTEWLRRLQKEKGISFLEKKFLLTEEPVQRTLTDYEQLAERMLSELPADKSDDPENWRVHELLAQLLLFHRRELKPVYWAMFDRGEMNEEELIEDLDCLGGLRRTARPSENVKRSIVYEYRFDPNQDTKLYVGQKCIFANDFSQKSEIEFLDSEIGLIRIKLGPKYQHPPPDRVSLIPEEVVRADAIVASIYRTVSHYKQTGILPKALKDLLFRLRPRIQGNTSGPILLSGLPLIDASVQAVRNLEESTLCIQGPPGCGKTYTGAKIILDLLKNGRRVGIASHSHKAITHLMKKVAELADEEKINFRGVKVGGNPDSDLMKHSSIVHLEENNDYIRSSRRQFQLVGATAWIFSRPEVVGELDSLFVDEAGQVSLANLVGMSPSAKNLVLLGDQMQLGQPVRGTHPGESGDSALDYLLQEHATIPEELGIFLPITYRMHPGVCSFISEMVYEGRLQAQPDTQNQSLEIPNPKWIRKNSGIFFLPVEHEGNTQSSDEEVEVIRQITHELLTSAFTDKKREKRPLTFRDILYVAPYNMQVRKLQQALGPEARVGSVDKFQGQEAPVVILSMCASSGDTGKRGIEFLLNKDRLNVAISRAQCLAIVVGNPVLARTTCSTISQMKMVNLFCHIAQFG